MQLVRKEKTPYWPWVAGPEKRMFRVGRNNGFRHEYAEIDRGGSHRLIDTIIIDIDDNLGVVQWLDSIPFMPAYFVGLRLDANGFKQIIRPHVVIHLKNPVSKNSKKAMAYYNAVRHWIFDLLEAEGCNVDYKQPSVSKNPYHPRWDVIECDPKEWTLDELALILDMDEDYRAPRNRQPPKTLKVTEKDRKAAKISRNCAMFDTVRLLAYGQKSNCENEGELHGFVLEKCEEFNSEVNEFCELGHKEVGHIATSISGWTWKYYNGATGRQPRNRGAAAEYIPWGASKRKKQAIGAIYSNVQRSEKAASKVATVRQEMIDEGLEPTIKGIAKRAGMARNTVRKYLDGAPVENKSIETLRRLKAGVFVLLPSDLEQRESSLKEGGQDSQSEVWSCKAEKEKHTKSEERDPETNVIQLANLKRSELNRICENTDNHKIAQNPQGVVAPWSPVPQFRGLFGSDFI